MNPYSQFWSTEVFDWVVISPHTIGVVSLVLGFAVVFVILWEVTSLFLRRSSKGGRKRAN